jgi:nucleoside-diphosphate-sugar epimerase
MRIVVAGATGRAGRHLVDALGRHGHEVVPIARSVGVDLIRSEGS